MGRFSWLEYVVYTRLHYGLSQEIATELVMDCLTIECGRKSVELTGHTVAERLTKYCECLAGISEATMLALIDQRIRDLTDFPATRTNVNFAND